MSLEQQAVEEEAEEEQGAANYQPLVPDDGKSKLVPVCQLVPTLAPVHAIV